MLIGNVKSHLRSGINVICPYYSCTTSVTKIQSFSSHLTRYHNAKATINETINFNEQDRIASSANFSGTVNSVGENSVANLFENQTFTETNTLAAKNLILFYMKLQTQHNILSHALQSIFEEVKKFSLDNLNSTLSCISSQLVNEVALSPEFSQALLTQALKSNDLFKTHELLNTDYKRKAFFKKEFNYIEPVSNRLGYNGLNKLVFFNYIQILK